MELLPCLKEYRRGGDALDRPAHEALIAEQTEHINNSGSISYDGQSPDGKHAWSTYISAQHISRNSYYGGGMDPNAYGKTKDFTGVAGAQYSYKFSRLLFMPSQLTIGMEYNYDKLHDISLGYNYQTNQSVHIVGAYLQNEWKNAHWSLLAGVRMDKHNLISRAIFSPRVNIRYSPFRDLGFRLIYAGGFRAPQAFEEDLHILMVGGERTRILLADNLKEERSHSFSLSGDWYHSFGTLQLNLMAEGFLTLLKDTYALRKIGQMADDGMSTITERYNGPGAKVFGSTLEGKLSIGSNMSLQAGIKNIFNSYQKDFDQGELRDSGYIYGPSLPRSIVIGTGLKF